MNLFIISCFCGRQDTAESEDANTEGSDKSLDQGGDQPSETDPNTTSNGMERVASEDQGSTERKRKSEETKQQA